MSDTPITDAEAYDYETGRRWLDGVVSAHIVRKLERENAALKEQLNHTVSTKYHDEIVQEAVSLRVKETDNLRSELRIAESFHRIAVSERDALVVENAALRAYLKTGDMPDPQWSKDDILHMYDLAIDERDAANESLAVLHRENAALRADKERLDWLQNSPYWPHPPLGEDIRAAIDAARKEIQS